MAWSKGGGVFGAIRTHQIITLGPFFDGVFNFYMEVASKAIKYFTPALESKLLTNLKVLNPSSFEEFTLDQLKSKYKYIAEKFPNIIKTEEVP